MLRTAPMVAVAVATFAATVSTAAPRGVKYDDPAKAAKEDPDFAIQGEYSGVIPTDDGQVKVGVQVIALGGGKFHLVAYPGGLPGDGWNREKKFEADGETQDGRTVFKGEHGSGTIKDGVLTVVSSEGKEIGKLKKVARTSPTLGQKPPKGAVVLFDGSGVERWNGGRMTADGLLMEGTTSKRTFQSQKLHIEFRLPYAPHARGQGRGNSGLYLQGRYEVQMLDSFGLEGKDNECGGIYSIKAPDVNMCFPPLTWQTYDVEFTAGEFDAAGNMVRLPRMTVRHNGVVVHKNVELPKSTTAAPKHPGKESGPVYLQNHGNPIRYRNIWVVETKD